MRNKKMKITLTILLAVTAMGLAVPVMAENNKETTEEKETEKSTDTKITAEKNGERKITITLLSVTGNKITYIEQETEEVEEAEETLSENTAESDTEDAAEKFPEGAELPEGVEFRKSGKVGFGEDSQKNNAKTVFLPVSVPVHIGDTEVRTFTILQSGDILEVALETGDDGEEVITEIWLK